MMDNFSSVFSPVSAGQAAQLSKQTVYIHSQFVMNGAPQNRFSLAFTDHYILLTQAQSLENIKFCVRFTFELNFEILHVDQDNITSTKIGLTLFHQPDKILELLSQENLIMHQIQLFLKRKINQRGFHGQFRALKKIGKGNFASVYEVRRIIDGKKFAVKAFSKQNTYNAQDGKESLINQLNILRKVNHKNISYLQGIYESNNSLYVVLQLVEGKQLFDVLRLRVSWSLAEIKDLLRGILLGLEHLHKKRIIHRDMKPENILLRKDDFSEPVIVDFGLATLCDLQTYIFNRCGTPGFVSPQIITQKEPTHIEPVCDVFSVGILFHFLLTKKPVFEGKKYEQVLKKNRKLEMSIREEEVLKFGPEAMDLLKKMLLVDPKERITTFQALDHAFFMKDKDNDSVSTA